MFFLPTFNRLKRCQETLDSIAENGPSDGIVIINGGPDFNAYSNMRLPNGWYWCTFPKNQGVCRVLNKVFKEYPDEPWYGFMSDDSIVRTPNFQAPLVEAAGRWNIANSSDLWQAQERIHGAVVFGGDLVRAVGGLAPKDLWHCFFDDAWEAIAKVLNNRVYLPEIVVEHCHWGNDKAPEDDTYRSVRWAYQDDSLAFDRFIKYDFQDTIERVRAAMKAGE